MKRKNIPAASGFSTILSAVKYRTRSGDDERRSRRMTNERASRRNVYPTHKDGEQRRQLRCKRSREGYNGFVLLTFLTFLQLISGMLIFTLSNTALQRQMSFNYAENMKEKIFAYSLLQRFASDLITDNRQIPAQGKYGNISFQTKIESLDIDPCQIIGNKPAEYIRITLKLKKPSSPIIFNQAVIARPFKKEALTCRNRKIRMIKAGIQSFCGACFK